MATPLRCCSISEKTELWITYHQASRKHKPVTAQLIDVGERSLLFNLEDVLDHIFEQDFVGPKWRSVVWWEDCTCVRLKARVTVQELLARGAGATPSSALRLVIGKSRPGGGGPMYLLCNNHAADTPTALWIHYEYTQGARSALTATQRIRLDLPHAKLECLGHVTNYIFAQGYLPCEVRSLVTWKNPCGKRIEECEQLECLLARGEGACEERPLRLVVGASPAPIILDIAVC